MPRSIEKVTEDVFSLTHDIMLLYNSSKPHVVENQGELIRLVQDMESRQGFKFGLADTEKYMEVPIGMLDESEFLIYLNPKYPEWYAPIIADSQPYCNFLSGTRMGIALHQAGRTNLTCDKDYDALDGIDRFTEWKTIEWLSERGYSKELESVVKEISKNKNYIDNSSRAFEICENKWNEAYSIRNDLEKMLYGPGKKKPDYREIIALLIRTSTLDPTKKFNEEFFKKEKIPVPGIFAMPGSIYMMVIEKLISSQEAYAVMKLIDKFRIYVARGDEHQLRDINPVLGDTIDLLSKLGNKYEIKLLTSISNSASKLYKIIEDEPPRERIDQLKVWETPEKYENFITELQTLLTGAETEIKRYSGRTSN
jgi:hypothetical protein